MAAAAQDAARASRTFRDAVEVIEVTVPVWVLDDQRPVRGLTRDDFLLFDRGKRQTIVGFEVLDRSHTKPTAGLDATPVPDVPPTATATPAAQRNILALFDLHRLGGSLGARAVAALRARWREPLPRGDRWGIAVHGVEAPPDRNKSARMVVGFTTDRTRLARGLDAVQAILDRRLHLAATIFTELAGSGLDQTLRDGSASERFSGLSRPAVLTLLATRSRRGAASGGFGGGIPLGWLGVDAPESIDRDAEEGWLGRSSRVSVSDGSRESRLRWFTLAMADLVTFLRDLRGENHLLLLSDGGYGPLADSFTTARMQPMLAAFKRHGWTFQAIDIGGRGFNADDMFYMANETGGTLVENVRDVAESFARVAERTSVTYLLTFRPSKLKADGEHHKLEVKLRDKSRAKRVRHRRGYYAPAPAGRADPLDAHLDVMAAVLGEREITDVDVDVVLGAPLSSAAGYRVPVTVAADGASLLQGHDQPLLEVKIEGYVLDAGGGIADLFADRATIDLASVGHLAGNRLRLRREVELAAGDYRLRVWVSNVDTGMTSLTTTLVRLPPPGS